MFNLELTLNEAIVLRSLLIEKRSALQSELDAKGYEGGPTEDSEIRKRASELTRIQIILQKPGMI